jgi:hypothetical protein
VRGLFKGPLCSALVGVASASVWVVAAPLMGKFKGNIQPAAPAQARLEQAKQRARSARLATAAQRGSGLGRGAARAWLRARFAVADNISSALILAVFGFKVGSVHGRRSGGWVGPLRLLAPAFTISTATPPLRP